MSSNNEILKNNLTGIDLGSSDVASNPTPPSTSIPKPSTKNSGVTLNIEDMSNLVALSLRKAKEEEIREQSQSVMEARMLQESKTQNLVGSAVEVFKAKIEQEVINREGTYLVYYEPLAKKYGNLLTINISGYSISFIKGQKTFVPKSLESAVNLRLTGVPNTVGTMLENKILAFSDGNTHSASLSNEVADKIEDVLGH